MHIYIYTYPALRKENVTGNYGKHPEPYFHGTFTAFSLAFHVYVKLCKNMFFWPSEGAISDCFQPFPLGHLWTFKKKLRCAEMLI